MTRRIVRTPKQNLASILEHQLDALAVIAQHRTLDLKETRLLQVLAPLTQMSLTEEKPEDVLNTLDVEKLEQLAIQN